ncbi:protein N-acetyltransferase NAT2 [Beauveria bassiana ARSEF 2860]|uniref:Protein N-acetyltransferase NAT2 n=1 Tax=Beauveria bassiana (strain ARSEF 2860) TaxID=655819 RepID=J5JIW1_BEAB2|nr:protein N-acetyltransferase NAT2 [Beauveria bassiana ARSEF 2860]EJP65488.1 protein N-acetyltransferase NAT2 [Beauveria bassiana ARSEF 2860]
MLRFLLQGSGSAQRAFNMMNAPSSGALQGAWRRLYTTQRNIFRRSSAQSSGSRRFATTLHPLRPIGLQAAASEWAPASRRGFRFSAWRHNNTNGEQPQPLSLTKRLKKLFKDYGKSAIGVYLALSVLDFPFCFLLVRIVGTDTIGRIEHAVVSTVSKFIPESIRQKWRDYWQSVKKTENDTLGNGDVSETVEMMSWGVETAQEHHNEAASLGTQLALAYAIHKSFIFVRVPLTAALTPKIVKKLRSWGWNIGKKA